MVATVLTVAVLALPVGGPIKGEVRYTDVPLEVPVGAPVTLDLDPYELIVGTSVFPVEVHQSVDLYRAVCPEAVVTFSLSPMTFTGTWSEGSYYRKFGGVVTSVPEPDEFWIGMLLLFAAGIALGGRR